MAAVRFARQEEERRHHTYDEELLQYEKMKEGDMEAIPMSIAMFRGNLLGKLSEDPVRNQKYLFVASITMACRFCIEGGDGRGGCLRFERCLYPADGRV